MYSRMGRFMAPRSTKRDFQRPPPIRRIFSRRAPAFVIKDGDFAQVNYDIKRVTPEWTKVNNEVVAFLNKSESFVIPFAAGVADDAIGFQETAASFVSTINFVTPVIYYRGSPRVSLCECVEVMEHLARQDCGTGARTSHEGNPRTDRRSREEQDQTNPKEMVGPGDDFRTFLGEVVSSVQQF